MHCDLHSGNIHFDGQTVTLFDWNGGFVYKPGKVFFHLPRAPQHLFPPEGQDDKSAVHATVSGADIWAVGLIVNKFLKNTVVDKNGTISKAFRGQEEEIASLADMKELMMTEDPFQRPHANQLLGHAFLKSTS